MLLIEIGLAVAILIYLFFRKKKSAKPSEPGLRRTEIKLLDGKLIPEEVTVGLNQITELVIYRYDTEPREELFEIEALEIYELLPARHATIIKINPTKWGRFPIVLAAEKKAGTLVVE